MTAAEMKREFLTRYDAASSAASPGWEDSEISDFLNIGQMNLINSLVQGNRYDLLAEIVHRVNIGSEDILVGYYPGMFYIKLPSDFMYYVDSMFLITERRGDYLSTYFVNPDNIEFSSHGQYISTPNNRTLFRKPKAFIHNGYLTVITDSTTVIAKEQGITQNSIVYIRKPASITIGTSPINCELNQGLHSAIVELAVNEAIKAITTTKIKSQQ